MTTDKNEPLGGARQRLASLRGFARFRTIAIVAAVLAVLGSAYIVGGPAAGTAQSLADNFGAQSVDRSAAGAPANVGAPYAAALPQTKGTQTGTSSAAPSAAPAGQDPLSAALDASLIVKTGQMTLEVANLDSAVSQAQSTIAGMGGYVAASSRAGSEGNASATITYRFPVAHWDDALAALRKLASKTVSEQTDTSDVSSQAIDLDARLGNLKTTESALQAIMARASAIPDVLAVEQQLSSTQSEIEQLTAQRAHLGDQAAMSTVNVTFQLPSQTVTTQTAQGWQLGGQIDQAVAQLVRIGQGLATIVVFAIIVGLPILVGLIAMLIVVAVTRRVFRRGRRAGATPSQA
ncbi:MAG TPA: DUF4349 domain-containing protein [Candidatus Limnocylindrales bacterium]